MNIRTCHKWEYIKRIMDVIQLVVVVVGVGFSVYQINDIANNQLGRKNQLALIYFDRLNSGVNRKISIAIEHSQPIFKKFTTDDIDDFLGDLHDVGDRLNKKLLDADIVCSDFSDLTNNVSQNHEIIEYISKVRKINSAYFQGFDDLSNFVKDSC